MAISNDALGAFNWIVIEATCPACAEHTSMRCQTHEYRLGDTMPWFSPLDAVGEEACYSECASCRAELCVVIRFRGLVPEQVLHVSREDDWPEGYPR